MQGIINFSGCKCMIRVMFVCHGNICRSPMAEFVFRDLIDKKGLSDKFVVSSSATSTEEIWNGVGNPVYPPAKRVLNSRGINCEGKRAVQLKKEDYNNYDYLIGMDGANIRNMHRIFMGYPDKKINKLLTFAGRSDDVADPWYTGDFETTYRDVSEGCNALLEYIINNN